MLVFVVIIGILIVSLITITTIFLTLNMSKKNKREKNEIVLSDNDQENFFPSIQIIESKLIPSEKNKIVDSNVLHALSVIDSAVPNSIVTVQNTKTAQNIQESIKNGRQFFSASKKGTKNMLGVSGSDEVYGVQMKKNKFHKQTKFRKENELVQTSGKNALVNAGFSAASMVVGQYYMNEINNKLDEIKSGIKELNDFLDAEYQSKVSQIVSKMKEIIEYKSEILNNDYSRDKRYDEILVLETDCAQLLGQANEMIKNIIDAKDIDYKKYEKNTASVHEWFYRQQLLQSLLLEIGNLRYVLANGNESSKLSHTQYNNYLKQTDNVNEALSFWHKTYGEKFGIDLESLRREGKLFIVRKNTIGKLKENWAYTKIEDDTVNKIKSQNDSKKLKPYTNEKQDEIIKIQKYKSDYYNLPSTEKQS